MDKETEGNLPESDNMPFVDGGLFSTPDDDEIDCDDVFDSPIIPGTSGVET